MYVQQMVVSPKTFKKDKKMKTLFNLAQQPLLWLEIPPQLGPGRFERHKHCGNEPPGSAQAAQEDRVSLNAFSKKSNLAAKKPVWF